jgi:hypothetical protein
MDCRPFISALRLIVLTYLHYSARTIRQPCHLFTLYIIYGLANHSGILNIQTIQTVFCRLSWLPLNVIIFQRQPARQGKNDITHFMNNLIYTCCLHTLCDLDEDGINVDSCEAVLVLVCKHLDIFFTYFMNNLIYTCYFSEFYL